MRTQSGRADQWSEALSSRLAQALGGGDPLVVPLHEWYTGNTEEYDYWQPFVDLLDELSSHDPMFVTTNGLVDLHA